MLHTCPGSGTGQSGGSGSGSGSGGTITNLVTDPCLRSMVNTTINKDITTVINTLIQMVFNKSTHVNITYIDVTNLPADVNGFAPPVSGLDANGDITLVVQLNKNTMPHYSQEFIARVIMHESLHQYLTTIGVADQLQHEDIATFFVTQMAIDLQQMFPAVGSTPGLSDADAKNLALGGLHATDAFKQLIATDSHFIGSFVNTQSGYTTGTLGKRCN